MTSGHAEQPDAEWERVTRSLPCRICGHDSWCAVGRHVVLCMRTESPRPGSSGGWLHDLDGAPPKSPPKRRRPTIDWAARTTAYAQAVTDASVQQLATALHVDPVALRELGVGSDGTNWTFPMFGADGGVCGVRTRAADGTKRAMEGSTLGVVRRLQPDDGLLLVCEGESDTATALTLGHDALGVPGAGQCASIAAAYARGRDVVIVQDNDPAGADGAIKLRGALESTAKSIRLIRPPDDFKDLRAWHIGGAAKQDLDEAIAAAPPQSLGVIIDAWRPLPPGLLSQQPSRRSFALRLSTRDGQPAAAGEGDGLASGGIVAVLSAAGGTGKSIFLLLLAVCMVLGRRFLGMEVGKEYVGRRCCVLLGEERLDEGHRRLWNIAESLGLNEAERRQLEARLRILPLHGKTCGLIKPGENGALPTPTIALAQLQRALTKDDDPWGLVVIDPSSRFLPGSEGGTDAATAAIQAVETLTEVPGSPLVVVSGHSSKLARRTGQVDSRGVTALTDAARLHLTLKRNAGFLEFDVAKTNYAADVGKPLVLRMDRRGVPRLATDEERQEDANQRAAEDAAQVAGDADAVVEALRGRRAKSKDEVAQLAGIRAKRGRLAVDRALADERIVRVGTSKDKWYVASDADASRPAKSAEGSGHGVGVAPPPCTPRDAGTAAVPSPEAQDGLTSNVRGRQWDGGTANEDDGLPEHPSKRRKKPSGGAA